MTTKIPLPMLNSTVPQSFGFRNRIIDGGFTHNQRSYVSGTALASGSYGHDRWKGGAGGGTYTFTQAATGVPTTITITAGTLIQVIEGCNLPEGGTYTLSWSGTAQGRVASGSYAASPITVTGITAGANLNIEFSTGTVGTVQFEPGSVATSYEYRAHGQELALCQRYLPYWSVPNGSRIGQSFAYSSTTAGPIFLPNPVSTRVPVTGIVVSNSTNFYVSDADSSTVCSSLTFASSTPLITGISWNTSSGRTAFRPQYVYSSGADAYIYGTGCEL